MASGVFYDNIAFSSSGSTGVGDGPRAATGGLRAASPNPFSISTRVEFSLPVRGKADVVVYDIIGRRVATLFTGIGEAGAHNAIWDGRTGDGRPAPTGVYKCILQTEAGREARNVVLNR